VLVGLVVAVAIVGVVAISRAGLPEQPGAGEGTASPTPTTPAGTPLTGEILQWAAGGARLYVLAETCTATTCGPRLVTSGDEGRTWQSASVPAGLPATPAALRQWRLTVAGPDDRLTIEVGGTIVTSGDAGRGYTAQRITDGRPVDRVPTNQESYARLCGPPRCRPTAVEFLQPRTGKLSRLAHQPPFAPTLVAVEGSQLWAVAVDPATGRWTVAASTDDGAEWSSLAGPASAPQRGSRVRLLPVPGENEAYLVFSRPGDDPAYDRVVSVWSVPDPASGGTPVQVRPEGGGPLDLESAVATRDGRLVLAAGPPVTLDPDGVLDRPGGADPYQVPMLRALGRGLNGQLAGVADAGQVAALALNPTGDPGDWRTSEIYLTDR
jgi:hypothetical protein